MFVDPLGLTASEKHIPQVDGNTEKAKWLLVRVRVGGDAPKPGVLPLGSPSVSILLLKVMDLTEEFGSATM
jgi:hypothetical protein